MLTKYQTNCLKVLKRAPKTTEKAYDELVKLDHDVKKSSVGAAMRRLENKGLVRAREKWNRTLQKNFIVWELTSAGRNSIKRYPAKK